MRGHLGGIPCRGAVVCQLPVTPDSHLRGVQPAPNPRPHHTPGGADPDNLEYAGALMQRSLLEIARAADDMVTIFGAKQVG